MSSSSTQDGDYIEDAKRAQRRAYYLAGGLVAIGAAVVAFLKWGAIAAFFSHHIG